jgi:hypothetical protein
MHLSVLKLESLNLVEQRKGLYCCMKNGVSSVSCRVELLSRSSVLVHLWMPILGLEAAKSS